MKELPKIKIEVKRLILIFEKIIIHFLFLFSLLLIEKVSKLTFFLVNIKNSKKGKRKK